MKVRNLESNLINDILIGMNGLSNEDYQKLKDVLYHNLNGYIIQKQETLPSIEKNINNKLIDYFLMCKHIKNCSIGTLEMYKRVIQKFFMWTNKNYDQITSSDIRFYLAWYKRNEQISNSYLDTIRRNLSSFFNWAHSEGYIDQNPMSAIEPVKYEVPLKTPFTGEEMEQLRMVCGNERNRVVIETLYSTGMRVGELVSTNINQIDWDNKRIKIYGQKGKRERYVYLTPSCCVHIRSYLKLRVDNCEALIVSERAPFKRMTKSGIQAMCRKLSELSGIPNVHPHRFRRTLASDALKREMPIEQVQEILGHVKIETTRMYGTVTNETVNASFNRSIA